MTAEEIFHEIARYDDKEGKYVLDIIRLAKFLARRSGGSEDGITS